MTTSSATLDIGEVVARSGVPASTLHVWERHGVITPVGRSGLRRQYRADVLDRIALVVLSQRVGFSLVEIAELLAPGAFDDGKHALEHKLSELRVRRDELDAAIVSLEHALACEHASPMACPTFQSSLPDVLPVSDRGRPPPPGR